MKPLKTRDFFDPLTVTFDESLSQEIDNSEE
jgi:hypothetical protein